MIVADTAFWINHWKVANLDFSRRLMDGEVVIHLFVLGKLALGGIKHRHTTITDLNAMIVLRVVSHGHVMQLIETRRLYSRGVGYVDMHLFAATLVDGSVKLLTTDMQLHKIAMNSASRINLAIDAPFPYSRLSNSFGRGLNGGFAVWQIGFWPASRVPALCKTALMPFRLQGGSAPGNAVLKPSRKAPHGPL